MPQFTMNIQPDLLLAAKRHALQSGTSVGGWWVRLKLAPVDAVERGGIVIGMNIAFHIDAWTDDTDLQGNRVKHSYAVWVETRAEALAAAQGALPSTWKIDVPADWPPYGPAAIAGWGLIHGRVQRI